MSGVNMVSAWKLHMPAVGDGLSQTILRTNCFSKRRSLFSSEELWCNSVEEIFQVDCGGSTKRNAALGMQRATENQLGSITHLSISHLHSDHYSALDDTKLLPNSSLSKLQQVYFPVIPSLSDISGEIDGQELVFRMITIDSILGGMSGSFARFRLYDRLQELSGSSSLKLTVVSQGWRDNWNGIAVDCHWPPAKLDLSDKVGKVLRDAMTQYEKLVNEVPLIKDLVSVLENGRLKDFIRKLGGEQTHFTISSIDDVEGVLSEQFQDGLRKLKENGECYLIKGKEGKFDTSELKKRLSAVDDKLRNAANVFSSVLVFGREVVLFGDTSAWATERVVDELIDANYSCIKPSVIVVPHHGTEHYWTPRILELKPTVSVISVGKRYEKAVDRGYAGFGDFQHMTARDGDFGISFDSVFAGAVIDGFKDEVHF